MFQKLDLDKKDISFHLVGILGIGMSGLAHFLKWKGFKVSGSDRAMDYPENKELHEKLSALGINLYDQNGAFIEKEDTDYLVYSSAIEESNPDFVVGVHLPRLHRTELLVELFRDAGNTTSVAVAGTCGKTSVSSLIAETFERLGLDPLAIVGGFINSFITENDLGNFKHGNGHWMIFETDESDKSLLTFNPDYSILLNVGTDHYPKEELLRVFEDFLRNTQKGAVIEKELYEQLDSDSYNHLKIILFSANEGVLPEDGIWCFDNYMIESGFPTVEFKKGEMTKHFTMPVPGRYSAGNCLAAFALYELLGLKSIFNAEKYLNAMEAFKGVHRRFEYMGRSKIAGVQIYCDFAHNVEKLASAINCAKELTSGRVFTIFQAHGYKPFGFMVDELFSALEKTLSKDDRFVLMPVYYSGGTSSFQPKASDVSLKYDSMGKNKGMYLYFDSRENAEFFFKTEAKEDDIILVTGARDNSLPVWAKELVSEL